jgi:hypothetical protein
MSQLEMPIQRPSNESPVSYRGADVPPAFYRDADLPPPPPDDPHWREWFHGHDGEPVPRWLLYGLPAFLAVAGVVHVMIILVVLNLSKG